MKRLLFQYREGNLSFRLSFPQVNVKDGDFNVFGFHWDNLAGVIFPWEL